MSKRRDLPHSAVISLNDSQIKEIAEKLQIKDLRRIPTNIVIQGLPPDLIGQTGLNAGISNNIIHMMP